ncbi:MAG: hypothetical protein AAF598_19945 [Bacteroidota bacterium]
MILPIGTKVRLLHTGEIGRVTALLPNGMIEVHLEIADMEIPASAEDLVVLHNQNAPIAKTLNIKPPKKQVHASSIKRPEKSPLLTSKKQIGYRDNRGLLLIFEPVPDASGTIHSYRMHLFNDSDYQLLFELKVLADQGKIVNKNGKIEAGQREQIGYFAKDLLNENPDVQSSARAMTTDAPGPWKKQDFRIKPKSFFNKAEQHPDFGTMVHVFPLVQQFLHRTSNPKKSLQNYTNKHLPKEKPNTQIGTQLYNLLDVEAKANFKHEIDLHIEKLHPHPSKLTPSDIVDLQIQAFESYVARAVELGIPYV